MATILDITKRIFPSSKKVALDSSDLEETLLCYILSSQSHLYYKVDFKKIPDSNDSSVLNE